MKPIAAAVIEKGITLSFPEPEALAPPLLALDAAEAGYAPGAPVLSRLDLRVDAEDRIALLGANGNGKSTLLKLLAGRLAPLRGKVHRAAKLRVGYFAQHQLDDLDGERSPLAILREAASEWTIQSCRGHLARFGLAENQAETKVAALSGGEKARLTLALLSLGTPHLLLLDEPSNHLDIDSRQALIAAINEFPGAVVLVSHDPHLIELLADRLWLVEDGRVLPFAEDLDSYRSRVLRERRGKERTSKTAPVKEVAAPEASQRAADLAVAAIDKWRAALALIETKLADPALYTDARATERRAWQEKHEIAKRRLAEAEDHWLAAAERLEA